MDKEKANEIIRLLRKEHGVNVNEFIALKISKKYVDPFKLLIGTVLSQNTSDKNSMTAYDRLEEKIGVSPLKLAKADLTEIQEAIRPAGLHITKSIAIKKLAKEIIERYHGNLSLVLDKKTEEARKELMSLPHVGQKTADVLLLFIKNREVIPVDTHVARVSKRIGLAKHNAKYSEIQASLKKLYPPKNYLEIHLLLISHGRKICKAIKPRCGSCPIQELCEYAAKTINASD